MGRLDGGPRRGVFKFSNGKLPKHTATPITLSELALAHADRDKVRGAYLRGDMLEPEARRPMMEAWAAECAMPRGDDRDAPRADST